MCAVKKFGPFVLDRMIGRGGMGAVYRAREESTNQVVAVKALLLPLERERERFEAEISTLRLLRHENIVKLFGFGQENGVLYYAMEFVDGPSLSTLLRRGRRFTWEEVVYIGAKVCQALKHAHDRGVIHRDIKPANILLVTDGIVKVSDYGVAQYFGASRLTNVNQVVGTIEFMAPEQAQASAITPKTDIYALGALMYSLLTGRPPYVAKTLPELLKKFREGMPESIRATRPETPKVVDEVVLDLLQIYPEKRPSDARVVGRRLEALLYTSQNIVDGNPFLGRRFPTYGSGESTNVTQSDSVESGFSPEHVTVCKELDSDFKATEDAGEPIEDFEYRTIEDCAYGNLDFQSPFDKPTERATRPVDESSSRPEEERDDFFIGEGRDPELADASEYETSTGERQAPAAEESEPDVATSDGAVSDEPRQERYEVQPTLFAGTAQVGDRSIGTSDFHVSYDESHLAVDSSVENAVTTSVDAQSLLTSALKVTEPSADGGVMTLNAAVMSASASSASESPSGMKRRIQRSVSAETVVNPQEDGKARRRNVSEPQPAKLSELIQLRNVNFDAADEVEAIPVEKLRVSQFTPVDESELGGLPEGESELDSSFFVRFRFLWICLSLAALILFVATIFRAPSADRLYDRIDKTFSYSASKRFDSTLRRLSKDMRRFVELYPNDPRVEKVDFFLYELEIEELDQRMERQVQSPGRDSQSQPVVRAYLDARRAAQENWEEGSQKLVAFIELFGSDMILDALKTPESSEDAEDDDIAPVKGARLHGRMVQNRWKLWDDEMKPAKSLPDQLVVLANRRLLFLEEEYKTTRRADLALLNDRLIKAETIAKDDPERAAALRRAAETLYGRFEWAKSALKAPSPSAEAEASSKPVVAPPTPPKLSSSVPSEVQVEEEVSIEPDVIDEASPSRDFGVDDVE